MAAKKEVLPTDVKKGERLLVISSKNHGASINGSILTVITERINGNNYLLLSGEHGQRYNLYYSKPADSFRRVTRIEEAEYVEAGIIDLEAQIKEKKKEVVMLRKYKDKEAEIAAKLKKLMTAGTEASMAAILREMKQSDYL